MEPFTNAIFYPNTQSCSSIKELLAYAVKLDIPNYIIYTMQLRGIQRNS